MDERVLLVEDDMDIRDIVTHGLEQYGFRVTGERDGRQALIRFRQHPFDVVVLDVMLPSLDGLEVCRYIRSESEVPIVMLTAKTDTLDVVLGLEAGADDYVPKPFEMPELLARIRAVVRRVTESPMRSSFSIGDLRIDPSAFRVTRDGRPLSLTSTEFRLLLELTRHSGQVLTRDVLLERVWNYEYSGDSRLVDMAIKRLRQKIEDDPSEPTIIQTVRGVGYSLRRD
jgi:two-component system, OmpR family, response regulator MtrA